MTPRRFFPLGLLVAALGADAETGAGDGYAAYVQAERAARIERLAAPDGYLNLVGLYWLPPNTVSTFGAAPGNDLVFPDPAAPRIGTFDVTADGVSMHVADDVEVHIGGQPVESAQLEDDTGGTPTTVRHGALTWSVIRRSGRFAVRLRDLDSDAASRLPAMPYFPTDPAWRIRAAFRPYGKPREVVVGTVIEGLGWNPTSPGTVQFEIGGVPFELEAYAVGERLFFIFGDRTSGRETYPAGRFLYAPLPDEQGRTVLDFNLAYNPPCAFNDFSTCPVASPGNRLETAVTAGERYEPALHVGVPRTADPDR